MLRADRIGIADLSMLSVYPTSPCVAAASALQISVFLLDLRRWSKPNRNNPLSLPDTCVVKIVRLSMWLDSKPELSFIQHQAAELLSAPTALLMSASLAHCRLPNEAVWWRPCVYSLTEQRIGSARNPSSQR